MSASLSSRVESADHSAFELTETPSTEAAAGDAKGEHTRKLGFRGEEEDEDKDEKDRNAKREKSRPASALADEMVGTVCCSSSSKTIAESDEHEEGEEEAEDEAIGGRDDEVDEEAEVDS